MTARPHRVLEALSFRAWPPLESATHDGWVLRYAGGYSRRTNSVTPDGDAVEGLDERLEFCRRWYADRGLSLLVRLTSGSHQVDAALATRGFTLETPVDILTRAELPMRAHDAGVSITRGPTDAWFRFHRPLLGADRRDFVDSWRRILASVEPPTGFALLEADGREVAGGFAVADQDWVGLFQLAVHPQHRRRGFGRRLSENLLAWGAAEGATQGYLQVEEANTAGVGLYRTLGFRPAYSYWYRRVGR